MARTDSGSNALAAAVPHVPTRFIRRLRSRARPWTDPVPAPPAELQTVPGIRRNPLIEQRIHAEAPLHDFFRLHSDALRALGPVATMVVPGITVAPRLSGPTRRLELSHDTHPEALLIMVTSEEYRVAHVHRAAALDRAELIATSPF
jgi:hypothetical protein